jgi:hypothetical protein
MRCEGFWRDTVTKPYHAPHDVFGIASRIHIEHNHSENPKPPPISLSDLQNRMNNQRAKEDDAI